MHAYLVSPPPLVWLGSGGAAADAAIHNSPKLFGHSTTLGTNLATMSC
jgi:hypothetical protein